MDGAYDAIETHKVFFGYKALIEKTQDFRSERGIARITDFGKLFMKVCGPVGG